MKKNTIAIAMALSCCFGGVEGVFAKATTSDKESSLKVTYPLASTEEGGVLKVTNKNDNRSFIIELPYSSLSLDPGEYEIVELQPPNGCLSNVNKTRMVRVEERKADTLNFYNGKLLPQQVPLHYYNRKPRDGDVLVDNALYTGVRIGEYYWMNSNMNHIEPSWIWWTALVGEAADYPITQQRIDLYLSQVRLNKDHFQIDVDEFRKYYGEYYEAFTLNYMNSYAKMYEGDGGNMELTGWRHARVKDFRQLFGMCPFHPGNNSEALGEHDVRFALSAKKGDNPLTNIVIPGDCGATYWFDSNYVSNMYGFNMMPGGARINKVADGQTTPWSTNLCGTNVNFDAVTGDLYHLFYTAKFRAEDGHISIHDAIDTGYNISYHWQNVRWNRMLTDEELGYKLYAVSSDTNIMDSQEWNILKSGEETPLLGRIKGNTEAIRSINIVQKEYPTDEVIPADYVELPHGYIRGFYVQHILSQKTRATSVTVEDVIRYATRVNDYAIPKPSIPSGIDDGNTIGESLKMSVYPNPVQDFVNIDTKEAINSIAVYSLAGVCLFSVKTDQPKVDVSHLSAGTYLLRIETQNGSFSNTILKK